MIRKVSVIGAGTMGNGIAHVFAQNGFNVSLIDLSGDQLKKAISTIESNLNKLVSKEKIDVKTMESTLNNIRTFTDLKVGVSDADLVVEAAVENKEVKFNLFGEIDKNAPERAILATNTSSISITSIASATKRPNKVIGMHFMNPVPVMKLVEVIRAYQTSDDVAATVMDLSGKLGKSPVEVRDYPGFVANRILMPMINEAIISLQEGVAGVHEIDSVMKLGMAHPMGPLQLADFIGLDVCLFILNVMHEGFGNPKYAPCTLLVNMVNAGRLGVKSGEGFYDYSGGTRDLVVANTFKN